jgi:two-component system LytT family response regulator
MSGGRELERINPVAVHWSNSSSSVSLRALIVDDEPLASERLRDLLESEPDVQILGTCLDARSALEQIRRTPPDLLFLDLEMPGMDGFSLLRELPPEISPQVIIITAHGQFAVKAFEAQVADYLLKPFDRRRLRQAVQRARDRLQSIRTAHLHEQVVALRERLPEPPVRIPIKANGRIVFVRLDEVDWVKAADNYVELHVGQTTHLLHSTLAAFEARLPAAQFLRISRSTIVNLHQVTEVRSRPHGDCTVILSNGTKLAMTRGYRHRFEERLSRRIA